MRREPDFTTATDAQVREQLKAAVVAVLVQHAGPKAEAWRASLVHRIDEHLPAELYVADPEGDRTCPLCVQPVDERRESSHRAQGLTWHLRCWLDQGSADG